MVNISYTVCPEVCELEVFGHAGSGERGQDVVCAGVSTLIYTLANAIGENEGIYTCEIGDGRAHIMVRSPKEPTLTFFRFCLLGLEMIADSYPDNVAIK